MCDEPFSQTHSACELNFALELINTEGEAFTEVPAYGRQTFFNMQENSTDC